MGDDGKPLPYLDGVTFEILPDDATRILKVQSGELDGAEFIPFSRVEELKADTKLNMELFPSTKVAYGTFNVRPKLKDGSDNPLSNEKVRQRPELCGRQGCDHRHRDPRGRHADLELHVGATPYCIRAPAPSSPSMSTRRRRC